MTTATQRIAANASALLTARGMTQQQVADKLGVDQTTVSRWLNGRRTPAVYDLDRLADALHTTIGELCGPAVKVEQPTTPRKAS